MPLATPPARTRSTPARFAEARTRFAEGRHEAAEALCRRILKAEPAHAAALHLLGVISSCAGRLDQALDQLGRAIAANPGRADFHADLGHVFLDKNNACEADRCFRSALSLDPNAIAARVGLGSALLLAGHAAAAAACFRDALRQSPRTVAAWSNLGSALRLAGDLEGAETACRRALDLAPGHRDALINLGNVAMTRGRHAEAEALFRRALAVQPGAADALVSLGNALVPQEAWTEATGCFLEALRRHPDHPGALTGLGAVRIGEWRMEEALVILHRATQLRPDDADAHVNLGTAATNLEHLDVGASCFRTALAIDPTIAGAHLNLGNIHRRQGRLDEAIAAQRRAIAIEPEMAGAHTNLAMALLARGDWAEGWQEYEWRWRLWRRLAPFQFAVPQWGGEPGAGRTLLVHPEQGFGDTLQFCRFVPGAAARDLRVVLEVQPELVRIARSLAGTATVIAAGEVRPPFDLHCPMLSLPLALGVTPETVPDAPYLHPDPDDVARWAARLAATGAAAPDATGLRAGLIWAGNSHTNDPRNAALDRRRSIDPALLAPLLAIPGVTFVSLQKGRGPAPFAALVDPMDQVRDFADTAALLANLDLLVSVDSSVAHLAGAMGKPVLMMDRSDPCWRWFPGGAETPWYPNHRIHRQSAPGDWGTVVAAVVRDVAALAAEKMDDAARA